LEYPTLSWALCSFWSLSRRSGSGPWFSPSQPADADKEHELIVTAALLQILHDSTGGVILDFCERRSTSAYLATMVSIKIFESRDSQVPNTLLIVTRFGRRNGLRRQERLESDHPIPCPHDRLLSTSQRKHSAVEETPNAHLFLLPRCSVPHCDGRASGDRTETSCSTSPVHPQRPRCPRTSHSSSATLT
jgi:hypothetical protein